MNPCTKHLYASKADATAAMKKALRRRKNNPGKLRSYYCNECRGWHLTKLDIADFERGQSKIRNQE